jgi:hypothetical protein
MAKFERIVLDDTSLYLLTVDAMKKNVSNLIRNVVSLERRRWK